MVVGVVAEVSVGWLPPVKVSPKVVTICPVVVIFTDEVVALFMVFAWVVVPDVVPSVTKPARVDVSVVISMGVVVVICFVVFSDVVFGSLFGMVLDVLVVLELVTMLVLDMELTVLVLVLVLMLMLLAPVLVVSTWPPINAESMPLVSKLPWPEDLIGSWAIDISCGKLMILPLLRPITLDIDWNVSSLYWAIVAISIA